MTLNRDQFLSKTGRQYKTLNIPEFGEVRIQSMKTSERAKFELSLEDKAGKRIRSMVRTVRERLLIASVVDEDNKPMFTENDIEQISELPSGPVDIIVESIKKLSGFSDADLEELEGNSGATTGE